MYNYLVPKETVERFEIQLGLATGKALRDFVNSSLIAGSVLMVLAVAALMWFGFSDLYITTIPIAAFTAPLIANYFIAIYKIEQRKMKIEKMVPDVLLQASIFPKGSSMEKVISYISNAGYGELSKEFAKAGNEIKKGASVQEAFENMKYRNFSRVLSRAVDLLVLGYNSGADMGSTFREAADDLLESNSILRERNASMLVEKYTLLFAGGLIVPVVLGLIVGLITGFDFNALAEFEIGMSAERRSALLKASLLANTIYLAEYALLASAFVANQEGSFKKSILYAAILLPLSQFAYIGAQML